MNGKLIRTIRKIIKYKSFNYKKIETNKRNQRRYRFRKNLIAREGKCKKCSSTDNLTIDHIIPVSKGGSKHGKHNLQVLCAKCNYRKADKL